MGGQWARYGSLPSIDQNDLEISIDTHLPTERVEIGSLKTRTSLGRAARKKRSHRLGCVWPINSMPLSVHNRHRNVMSLKFKLLKFNFDKFKFKFCQKLHLKIQEVFVILKINFSMATSHGLSTFLVPFYD
jgi:hypothetical protein